MFFINLGKKILRGIGIFLCVLLAVLLGLMIFSAAAFGSAKTVEVFGFNVFICESGDFEGVKEGSAVITTKCEPYNLNEGNLVLYSTDPMDKNSDLAFGYYKDFKMTDGVYYLSLQNGTETTVISETALIGKAGWSSPFLGAFISFMKTPWGVFVMAVIPCVVLLLIDFIRARSESRPLPEIIPQVKNPENEPSQPQISVGENGSASFSKTTRRTASADSVLFTYGSPKKNTEAKSGSAPTMSDADVLSLLNAPSKKPETNPKPDKNTVKPFLKNTLNQAAEAPEKTAKPVIPAPVAAKRYIDNTVAPAAPVLSAAAAQKSAKSDSRTAELPVPEKPKSKRSDAFFAQSEAPQIGKGLAGKQASKSIIDLEDALAAASARTSRQEATRRSADILAAKSRRELIPDDDDSRDKSRYEVDDILAGIQKRRQK